MRKTFSNLLRRGLPMALALVMACGAMFGLSEAFAAPADSAEEYTYTVRIFAGNRGTIGGKDVVVIENLKYNDPVDFDAKSQVTVTDDKYYVRGVRESGRDNSEVGPIANVTRDIDYVVAYGIKGSAVEYTVNYQDEEGNTLMKSDTFWGNEGDTPAVAYRYIDGYIPEVETLSDTLKKGGKNEFTFVYTPIESDAEEVTPTRPAAP